MPGSRLGVTSAYTISVLGGTADGGHGDVRHGRFRRSAVPMALARFDVHDIANLDVTLFAFGCNLALPRRDDQDLIAIVDMPSCSRTDAEVDHVAAKIFRLPVADHRLPRSANLSAGPAGYRRRRVHRFLL